MSYRIPHYITLPFGYEIEIEQLTHKAFTEEYGDDCYACRVVGENGGTVYLDKSRDIKKRRADLVHEVLHAVADWQVKLLGGPRADAKD